MAQKRHLTQYDSSGNKREIYLNDDEVLLEGGQTLRDRLAEMQEDIDEAAEQGGIQQETDPTVPSWAKQPEKPTYTPQEVGAVPAQGYVEYTQAEKEKLRDLPNGSELSTRLGEKANAADVYDKQTVDKKVAEIEGGEGKSAYQSYLDTTTDNPTKTEAEWVASLKGQKGDTGNVVVSDGVAQIGIINDLETGGEGDALSAEMGKRLAMLSGTFAAAWAHSKSVPTTFCWLWQETVDGSPVCKPIWHVGNSAFVDAAGAVVSVDAPASVPLAPTITMSEQPVDGKYPKGTVVTITPVSGSALYYSVDGGSTYKVSDVAVAITLDTAGVTINIDAYCVNQAGQSASHATQTIVVQGVSTPQWSQESGSVTRGGSVTISPQDGGTLYYSVDGGTEQSSNSSVASPITNQDSQNPTTIIARNVVDGTSSVSVTKTFYMAALDAPEFSPASGELPSAGGTVELSAATGADIYYNLNTDGTDPADPTDASTQYTVGTPISVSVATKIKAIAKDPYGSSAVSSASYTIKEAGITIVTTAPTTLTMPNATGSPFSLAEGKNVIPFSQIGSSVNMQGNDLLIGDATAIKSIDWDGFSITNASWKGALFYALFKNKDAIEEFLNLTIATDSVTSLQETFYQCDTIKKVKISGTAENIAWILTNATTLEEADFSGLTITNSANAKSLEGAFMNTHKAVNIDIRGLDCTNQSKFNEMFKNCGDTGNGCELTIGSGFVVSAGADITNMFTDSKFIKLRCTSSTPPAIDSSVDWLAALVAANPNVVIEIPVGSLSAYQSANGWSSQSSHLTEVSTF